MLAGVALLAQPLAPAVLIVEGDCSLVNAIAAANRDVPIGGCPAGSGADEIWLTGDVLLTRVDNQSDGPNGLPVVRSPITLRGEGFAVGRAADAPDFRIFRVNTTGDLALEDVTIRNGTIGGGRDGAGIRNGGGALSVARSVVRGNSVTGFGYGGGISNNRGVLLVTDTLVTENESAIFSGSGIHNLEGTVTLVNSSVSRNASASENVGAIRNDGRVAELTVIGSAVSHNAGGGIGNYEGTVRVLGSTFAGNHGSFGNDGAITIFGGSLMLLNSTISGNSFGIWNGRFYVDSELRISNSTIFGNDGAGIFNYCYPSCDPQSRRVFLTHSIVAGNDGDCTAHDDAGPYVARGVNFDSDGSCPQAAPMTGIDPELALNGGPTRTHALLPQSAAIDAAGDCRPTFDQRGFPRQPSRCDAGAFEFGAQAVEPQLAVRGSCPGEVSFSLAGATPLGSVALVTGSGPGSTTVPAGSCEGLEVELDDAEVHRRIVADVNGEKTFSSPLQDRLCGALLQAVDLRTCAVGDLLMLPE